MFAIKTVYWVGILSTLSVKSHTCHSISDVKSENVSTDKISEIDLELTLDSPVLNVTEGLNDFHVKYVTEASSTVAKSEGRQDSESDAVKSMIQEILRDEDANFELPLTQKRVTRQSNPGYSLYPTLPVNGNNGAYNPNNATYTYSHGYQPNVRLNTTNPTHYNYPKGYPSMTNFSASAQNPYQFNNPQYPYQNGRNASFQPFNNNLLNPGAPYNSGHPYVPPNRPSNFSTNPYLTQPLPQFPTTRPFQQGVTHNRTNPTYPGTRPYYPGSAYPGTSSNQTNPSFTGPTHNGVYPGYPEPTSRNSRPNYPQTINNRTNPIYPQSTTRPIYPGASNVLKPGYFPYPNNFNTTPSYDARPHFNLPSNPTPYNSQNGNFPYNPNYLNNSSSPYGRTPGSQRPSFNNSGPNNSWGRPTQSYGQTSLQVNNTAYNPLGDLILHNPNSKTPPYRPYNNYTNNYTPSPNSQYFGNTPNGPYSQNNLYPSYPSNEWNKQNPTPNPYNAEHNRFFYPPKNNGSSYDPRKNPPEHFSYH